MISSSDILHGKVLIVDDKEVNIFLLDLQMPGMDGFQVMESLKEIETAVWFSSMYPSIC